MSKRTKLLAQAAMSAALVTWSASHVRADVTYNLYQGGNLVTSPVNLGGSSGSEVFQVYADITGLVNGSPIVAGGITDAVFAANLTYATGSADGATVSFLPALNLTASGYQVGSSILGQTSTGAPESGLNSLGGTSNANGFGWVATRAFTSSYFVPGTAIAGGVQVLLGTLTVSVSALQTGDGLNLNLLARNNQANQENTQIWYQASNAAYLSGATSSSIGAVGDYGSPSGLVDPGNIVLITNSSNPLVLGQWGVNGVNNYNSTASWTTSVVPGITPTFDNLATFGTAGSGTATINVPVTLRGIVFNNTSSYTLADAGNTITLDQGSTSAATVTLTTGSHNITAAVNFANVGLITAPGGGTLNLGAVTAVGALTLTSNVIANGTVSLNSVSNSASLTLGGGGAVGGAVTGGGSITAAGVNFNSSVTQASLSLSGTTTIAGAVAISGGVSNSGNVNFNGGGTVTGALTGAGSATVAAATSIGFGSISHGAFTANGTVTAGAVTISNAGASTVIGSLGSLTINGAASLQNITNNGSLALNGGGAFGSLIGSVGSSLTIGSGLVTATQITGGGLTVNGTLDLTAAHISTQVITLSSLSLGGSGVLNLNNHDMIIRNAGTTGLYAVQADLAAGYNGGGWNGSTGIISSAAAATAVSGHPTALGFGLVSALTTNGSTGTNINIPIGGTGGTFDGQTVYPNDVIIEYTMSGDANLDGTVGPIDFYDDLAPNWTKSGQVWINGDFNYDGTVGPFDFYDCLAPNWTLSTPALPAGGDPITLGSAVTAVPEPTTLGVLGLGVASLLLTRRRRR